MELNKIKFKLINGIPELFFRFIFLGVIVQPLIVKYYENTILVFILILMSIVWCLTVPEINLLEDEVKS